MPSSITHQLIAEEAIELLPAGARKAAEKAPAYYLLGAQGPDLFFFYRPFKRGNFGKTLHRGAYPFFSAMLGALPAFAGEDFAHCLAYALGFCSHLAADVVFHPFIYRYLQTHDAARYTHQQIETDWDVYFLRVLRGKSATGYTFPFDLKAIARDGALCDFLGEAFRACEKKFDMRAFRRMTRLFGLYLGHFHRARGRVLRHLGFSAFYPRTALNSDYLGGKNFAALSEGRGADADALFLHAVRESAHCISAFLEAFNADTVLPKELFARNLLTGEETETFSLRRAK